jgi:glycosyltransferase involved in cell wall biosynthesis
MSAALSATPSGDPGQRLILVGTYPPRRCGLATFTANTRRSLVDASTWDVDVLRLGGDTAAGVLPREVVGCWDDSMSAAAAADLCNEYSCTLLEHEYGILPGCDGADVIPFVSRLEVPLVSVLHTILIDPSARQRTILEAVARASSRVVVLTPSAADRLVRRYEVDPAAVVVIPHGAEPNLGPSSTVHRSIPQLLTWGLLGPGKGIEHAIRAVAILAGRGHIVRYVVAGQTHPNVVAHEGERYRHTLERLAHELGVQDLVSFDNRYRDWSEVFATIRDADLVVLPYESREQVTSGVLVDAIASGKPIVATAFPHALDIVDGRCGIVVPHEEPVALADAVERMLTDRRLAARCVAAARAEAARHAWPVVGSHYAEVLRAVVDERSPASS